MQDLGRGICEFPRVSSRSSGYRQIAESACRKVGLTGGGPGSQSAGQRAKVHQLVRSEGVFASPTERQTQASELGLFTFLIRLINM